MKLATFFLGSAVSVLVVASLSNPWSLCSGAENPPKKHFSTDSADREHCQRQLNIIYGAIQEYQKRRQKLPRWLSDLVPEFIRDDQLLVCPFVRNTGNLKKWKEAFAEIPVFGDAISSYAYEFCTQPLPGHAENTTRDYKQRQMEVVGFAVPIVRCFAHRPVLNLAFDGNIYESEENWEYVFGKSKEDELFFHRTLGISPDSQNQMVTREITPRSRELDSRMVDLSPQFNALLLHLSQVDHRGNLLKTYPEGLQGIEGVAFDIRGLVHLKGKDFPIAFPDRIDGIAVNQKSARIHFLHGTMFEARNDSKIGSFLIHYSNKRTNEIPILYGKDVKTRWFDHGRKSELENPKVAWFTPAQSVAPGDKVLRLYHKVWQNPNPDWQIESISFVSDLTESAPFLVAITLE